MKQIVFITLIAIIILAPVLMNSAIAQPPNPTAEPIPIDGGLGFLIAAGMAYGAKKLYNKEKGEAEHEE